ncbi:MAG: 2-oxo acid dehydrogenase subunit E2 [Chloroflexi bacterium]|nr:2-oxo acid dehydrogenase subunit E2 [Chloroflexota bacterium]
MDVRLPKLGEGADSGSVVTLFVKVGDQIAKGQTILELENEKAVAPIPSPVSGRIASIRVKEGDKVTVGQVLLTLAGEGSEGDKESAAKLEPLQTPTQGKTAGQLTAAAAKPVLSPPDELEQPEPTEATKAGFLPAASPTIRKLARDLGIDLSRVRGSEQGGRIALPDLKAYIERLQEIALKPREAVMVPEKPAPESIDFSKWGPIVKKPLSSLRQTISRRMLESWTTIPHVTQFDEADITVLMELRKKHQEAYEQKGVRLTLTSFALKAALAALKKFPIVNASLDDAAQVLVFKDYYHIGLAVDTEAGLIVPIIRDVDKKTVLELSRELSDLAEKARSRKIALEDLKGGSFTISNQGGIGGAHFTPIVNKPQLAILGLGRSALKPMIKGDAVERRLMLPVCLSYDHRVIDGGMAVRFVVEVVQALENFQEEAVKL